MAKDTVNWKAVEELGYRRATRLRQIEHMLVNHPNGIHWEDLCSKIGLNTRSKARTLQNDLNELRALYCGNQFISPSPHRLELRGGDLAFPEAEFTSRDRKQLAAICRLITFFDGAVPIKKVLNVTIGEVEDALKSMSDSIDVATDATEIKYIKEIYEAIEGRRLLDVVSPRLNGGEKFAFAPYMLKRFNNKWFVIGRMCVENPFDWTVIPLAAIPILNAHKGDCKYTPQKESELKNLKARIHSYYDKVLGFHVPTSEKDPDKLPRELDPEQLPVERVRLKVVPNKLRFVKENPIHATQQIYDATGEVTLDIVVNPLLIQRILGFGDDVEVLEPASLKYSIRETARRMLEKYDAK